MLAKDGANLHVLDVEGRTPLQLCRLNGKRKIAEILEEGLEREGAPPPTPPPRTFCTLAV